MPENTVGSAVPQKPPMRPLSTAEQLAEVYALVDELHEVTDRIRVKMDRIIRENPAGQPAGEST